MGQTAGKKIRNKVLFFVLSLEGKNQRNFEKDHDSKKAKVPKSKKHRNEQVHFCVFAFGTRHRRCRRGDYVCYIITPASFALQDLAAPITRKFLGCNDFFGFAFGEAGAK